MNANGSDLIELSIQISAWRVIFQNGLPTDTIDTADTIDRPDDADTTDITDTTEDYILGLNFAFINRLYWSLLEPKLISKPISLL